MQKVNDHTEMFVDFYFYVTSYEYNLFFNKGGKVNKYSLKKEKLDYFVYFRNYIENMEE